MTERVLLVLYIVLNVLSAIFNLYIGGWNVLVAAFSYSAALFCSYVLGRIS